ncbi:MAG: hypothetical protein IJ036_03235 [Lachnospiraceae bacterium]|nr:hypothetical protein [Lachnospiraceae bacterium]
MKAKRRLALNKLFNLFIITGPLLLLLAYHILHGDEIGIGIFFGIIGLLMLATPLLALPYCYLFDEKGVSAHYVFFPPERYLWENIHSIRVVNDSTSSSHAVFDLLFGQVFEIKGNVEGQKRFYMKGQIQKSLRTKHLLEAYWDGTITGYLGEDMKAWWNKHMRKKPKTAKHYLNSEIISMEKNARAKVQEYIKPFIDRAALFDLELHTEYIYLTKNFQETKKRPAATYTYLLLLEISYPGETNEDRILRLDVELLYGRLGKTDYKGVENKDAWTELHEMLTETLDEIERIGFENYFQE